MKELNSIQHHACNVEYGFTDAGITDRGGITFPAYLAKASGLVELLASVMNGTLKTRRRGATEAQSILSQVYVLATGKGHLSDLDDARADRVFRVLTGLGRMPSSRRMGEFLGRFRESDLVRLRELAIRWLGPLTVAVAHRSRVEDGFVPVFIDSSDIEVSGKCFEGAMRGYQKIRRYQMHSVFVGNLMVSVRLNDGRCHATHGWREQLDLDALPLLSGESDIWVRADNAYYKGEFAEYCAAQGWDFSVSVTNLNCQSPVLATVMDAEEAQWEWINEEEKAMYTRYRPRGWKQAATYVVVRQLKVRRSELLLPTYTVILVSTDRLPVSAAVARHRGKQGQENAFKGPLTSLNLHHPPCSRFAANQAFYLCGLLAQALLRGVDYWQLPESEWRRSLGTIIDRVIRQPAVLTRSSRRWRLLFSKNQRQLHRQWLLAAMDSTGGLKRVLLE